MSDLQENARRILVELLMKFDDLTPDAQRKVLRLLRESRPA